MHVIIHNRHKLLSAMKLINIFLVHKAIWLFTVFFGLLFALLFLGDGPSSFVDLVGAAVVIIISFIAFRYPKIEQSISRTSLVAWSCFLTHIILSVIFSVDIGLSIRSVTRYFEAFIIYYIFYMFTPKQSVVIFIRMIVGFGLLALGVSVGMSVMPAIKTMLPSMNLLWSNAGHNHIVDIWLLVLLPLVIYILKTPRFQYVLFLLVLGVFVWAQARAALLVALVAVVSFVTRILRQPLFSRKINVILVVITLVITILMFLTPELSRVYNKSFEVTRKKNSFFQERRTEYWRQATNAILEKPIVGFGPGTFYLLSNKYQKEPSNSSWFAHNFLLEMASEIGIIGAVLFLWVVYSSYIQPASQAVRHPTVSKERKALLFSPLILFVYGLVDFPINYFVVWVMLWATIGISIRHET